MKQFPCYEVANSTGRTSYKNFFHVLFSKPKLKIVNITNEDSMILIHAAYEGNLRIHNASISVVKIALSDIEKHINEFSIQNQSLLMFLSFLWKKKGSEKDKIIAGTIVRMRYENEEMEFDLKAFTDELSLHITKKQISALLNNIF